MTESSSLLLQRQQLRPPPFYSLLETTKKQQQQRGKRRSRTTIITRRKRSRSRGIFLLLLLLCCWSLLIIDVVHAQEGDYNYDYDYDYNNEEEEEVENVPNTNNHNNNNNDSFENNNNNNNVHDGPQDTPYSSSTSSSHQKDDNEDDDDDDYDSENEYDPEYELYQHCRRNPMWQNEDRHDCQELMELILFSSLTETQQQQQQQQRQRQRQPLWWNYHAQEEELRERRDTVWECLEENFYGFVMEQFPNCDYEEHQESIFCRIPFTRVSGVYHHFKHGNDIVSLEMALSPQEVVAVQALGDCVGQIFPQSKGKLSQYNNNHVEHNNNHSPSITYLTGFLQVYLPGVAAQIMHIATAAVEQSYWSTTTTTNDNDDKNKKDETNHIDDYHLPHPSELGIRTVKLLEYNTGDEMKPHIDEGSVFSVFVSLSDHGDDYQGGAFRFANDGSGVDIMPTRGMAYVIVSDAAFLGKKISPHTVLPLTGGVRDTLAVELWTLYDSPIGFKRPNSNDVEAFRQEQETKRQYHHHHHK